MYICTHTYIHTVEGNNFATFEQHMFKKSSQTKAKPQSPYNLRNQGCGDKHVFNNPPLRKETFLQLSTLSEGVGGDMARDTYEMTSPRRTLYYALRVAKYIPPTVYIYIYIYTHTYIHIIHILQHMHNICIYIYIYIISRRGSR